jgi:UDP-glucose 4-epimerase
MAIQRTSENIWNLGACVTGKVKTTISKASALTKDTLNIVVSTRSPYDNYFIDSNPITVTTDTLWTKAYYYNDVGLIQYIIELKKENGDIIRWIEEKELQPKETIKFDIEF